MVLCAVFAAYAAPFLRIGSGPLNASVENERDAAIDRAVAWLVASQSPEGHWGGSNVVATAVAALAIRGDREEMPKADAVAVEKAAKWLQSSTCTNVLFTIPPLPQESYLRINGGIPNTPRQRAIAWRRLSLIVLSPSGTNVSTNNPCPRPTSSFVFAPQTIFDEQVSSTLAYALLVRLGGWGELEVGGSPNDPALAFIAATFVTPPPELKPLVEKLARIWNEGSPAVWLSNPEAGWWLARAINGVTGGNLSLPPDADGRVRNVNWRGIMAGKWINSQRIDREGNGHWDNDAEKTAFAVLLLNEM